MRGGTVLLVPHSQRTCGHDGDKTGNLNSVSDTGVAALCAGSAIAGAHLNVKINAINNKDNKIIKDIIAQALKLEEMSIRLEKEVMDYINKQLCISSD